MIMAHGAGMEEVLAFLQGLPPLLKVVGGQGEEPQDPRPRETDPRCPG